MKENPKDSMPSEEEIRKNVVDQVRNDLPNGHMPSEEEIRRNIRKQIREENPYIRSPLKLLFLIIVLCTVLFFLMSETILSVLLEYPDNYKREYLLESCAAKDFNKCDFIIRNNTVEMSFIPVRKMNISFDNSICQGFTINHTITLNNCSFSHFYNNFKFRITYDSNVGLSHKSEASFMTYGEITGVKSLLDKLFSYING